MPEAADVLQWVARRRKAGWGEGEGANYKPWLDVRSFPSRGTVFRVLARHGRTHHFMSGREHRCFLLLDWSDLVTDIREQYPLHDLAETQAIAGELGFKHPAYRRMIRGRRLVREEPLTTDFLVSLADVPGVPPRLAISVKPAEDLDTRPGPQFLTSARKVDRLLEKAELERQFWARRGVPFRMVTDHELPDSLIFNLDLVRHARTLDGYPFKETEVPQLLHCLYDHLVAAPAVPLAQVCATVEAQLRLPRGGALALAWHAIGTKQWVVDLTVRLDPDRPLQGLALPSRTAGLPVAWSAA